MRFDIYTLFPSLFDSVFSQSIVSRAVEAELVSIGIHNIRDYATDRHHVTDDTPYGGGGGMVMKVDPIVAALESTLGADLLARQKAGGPIEVPVILLSPAGTTFDQGTARRLECYGHVALICGRYEGVDQRVIDLVVTHELSIGDFVVSGGEIPAMVVVEAVTRLVPGVLGDMRAVIEDSHASGLLEYPHYTRPAEFRGLRVPDVLVSGDHARVARWRRDEALRRTLARRPDLLTDLALSARDRRVLEEAAEADEIEPNAGMDAAAAEQAK